MKPTNAQIKALQIALEGRIRYYKGGLYTNPFFTGSIDQKKEYDAALYSTTLGTLRACVNRGWMSVGFLGQIDGDIYRRRWKITNEGIDVVNEVRKTK